MQQIDLFVTESNKTYGELTRERMHKLATSPDVINEMLGVFRANSGQFIRFHDKCYDIWKRYDLGSYINDSLHYMLHLGLLEEKRIYNGAESPRAAREAADLIGKRKLKKGEKAPLPYLGYCSEYRLKSEAAQ